MTTQTRRLMAATAPARAATPTAVAAIPAAVRKALPLDQLRLDGGTQSRMQISEPTVAEYLEAMTHGATLPPVGVMFDGSNYWLWDGFHRLLAHVRASMPSIDALVTTGTQRDAVLASLGANAAHGLRRTNADKRRAVLTMLADAEWAAWSDRAIAEACGVSHTLVQGLRPQPVPAASEPEKSSITATNANMEHSEPAAAPSPTQAAAAEVVERDPVLKANVSALPAAVPPAILAQREPGPVTVVAEAAGKAVEEDDAHSDAGELLDEMEADLRRAEARVAELEAAMKADGKAALVSALQRLEHAERQAANAQENTLAIKRRADAYERTLARIGRAVGQPDLDKVAAVVEAMAREAKRVKA